MTEGPAVLAVIPARGGSKGLPGKNIRPFAGLPLIAHTVLFAKMCPEINRCVVSTDSQEIADTAMEYGADVPFIRPLELGRDDVPLEPVLRHALEYAEREGAARYDMILLLDPTSPARATADVTGALRRMRDCPSANGIWGVSQPDFNPIWHCVVERDGFMADLVDGGSAYHRRQDVPPVYRINGSLYIWRTELVRSEANSWRRTGQHLIYELPDIRAISIDTEEDFQRAELLVKSGLIEFPWLDQAKVRL